MFWKSVSLQRFKSVSLVTKLMVFYSFSTIGILFAIGLFLYPTFIKVIHKVNDSGAAYITAECYQKLIIILLLGSLGSILFGYLIARNGLSRIRHFENKIEQITAESLHERINIEEWPKELQSFGKKFNTMLDRIQTSFLQLSQFSSDIAHELRTPLHNLQGMTELALTQEKSCNQNQELLEKYMQEFQQLSRLIEHLLFLARSDHGQLILKKEIIYAHEEIVNICSYYQAIADEHNIELTCTGDHALLVDATLFKRMISNLIANALKHTTPNGKIRIHIEPIDHWVAISIHDTGKGISEEHTIRLFDRFYRVDSSRSSQSGGLGLGLAIVKSIIDLHKGKITIQSKLNVGTSVFIQLPAIV